MNDSDLYQWISFKQRSQDLENYFILRILLTLLEISVLVLRYKIKDSFSFYSHHQKQRKTQNSKCYQIQKHTYSNTSFLSSLTSTHTLSSPTSAKQPPPHLTPFPLLSVKTYVKPSLQFIHLTTLILCSRDLPTHAIAQDAALCSLSSGVNYLVHWTEGLDLITGTK